VPITALIADDEEAQRAQLLASVKAVWPQLDIVAEASNGIDAWDAFLEREPQVCFLDVRMPGLTGVEVAQRMGAGAHVIFVAAPGDHAVGAFNAYDVAHVLKPVDPARLRPVIERVKERLDSGPISLHGLLDQLAGQVRRPAHANVLPVPFEHDDGLMSIDDVIFFESDSRATRVVHARGEMQIRTPLKELLGQLDPAKFAQIHRSIIVNRRHIGKALQTEDGSMVITLFGRSERLPVARHFQPLFALV
jgi:DNA-binding LytR/AlgR family response regulator